MTRPEELFTLLVDVLPDDVDVSVDYETGKWEFYGLEGAPAVSCICRVSKRDIDRVVERKQAELVTELVAAMKSG